MSQPMNRSLPSLIAGALLVAVLALYMITYQVRFTQVAVMKTFGRSAAPKYENGKLVDPGDVITEPGLYWKWPWPIQQVSIYDNRIQLTANPGEETPTRDGKPVIVTTTMAWRIKDPYLFSRTCGNEKEGAERLRTLVRDRQKTAISQHDFKNFVSTDPKELEYDQIEKQVLDTVQTAAAELYGIQVESVGMERLALPQRITETVFDAMKKERQAQAALYTSVGEAQASQIKSKAEGIAKTILAFADGKAKSIENEGLAQANQLIQVFQQDEELANFLLKVENLPKILTEKGTTIVLDQTAPVLDLLFPGASATTRPATPGAEGPKMAGAALPPEMMRPAE